MSHKTITKRQKPVHPVIFEHRRTWGARLLVELNSLRKDSAWLATAIGFKEPHSMRQIINGHHPMSLETYKKIVETVPEMKDVPVLAHFVFSDDPSMKRGARGRHKKHKYPKLGPRASRRPRGV